MRPVTGWGSRSGKGEGHLAFVAVHSSGQIQRARVQRSRLSTIECGHSQASRCRNGPPRKALEELIGLRSKVVAFAQ